MNKTMFRTQFTKVKGISDIRRLPIRDKIRLGVKKISQKTGKEYPKETDFFVCTEEVKKVYGDQPKELDIRLPINDLSVVFPQSYIWWGITRGSKCRGDGEKALRLNEETKEMEERECPCEKLYEGQCKLRAQLRFFLEKVSLGELFAINLGSFHSIVDINSSLEFIEALVGKFSMIPLKLKRVQRETHANGNKQIHWTLKIVLESNDINYINSLRESTKYLPEPKFLLPSPVFENPALDEDTVVEIEENGDGEINPEKEQPTEDEAIDQAKKIGMIPEDKSQIEEPQKLNDAKILNECAKIIAKAANAKELQKWFNEFKKSPGLSQTMIKESIKMVNEKINTLNK